MIIGTVGWPLAAFQEARWMYETIKLLRGQEHI